jgi:hypothetical protein
LKRVVWAAGGATLLLVVFGVLIASTLPDGLSRVAEKLGFAARGAAAVSGSPFAGYRTRYFESRWAAQASAGLVGVVLLYGFGLLFGKAVRRKRTPGPRRPGAGP